MIDQVGAKLAIFFVGTLCKPYRINCISRSIICRAQLPTNHSSIEMGKKKPEMSQVYLGSNNEFIFGEHGGKGKNLSSFLKNLSLTSSSSSSSNSKAKASFDSYEDANINIYGTLGYGSSSSPKRPLLAQRAASVGAGGFSHLNQSPSQQSLALEKGGKQSPSIFVPSSSGTRRRSHSVTRYADLDDDWDADLKEVSIANKKSSKADTRNSSRSSISLQPSPMLDSLYPDLTMSAATVPNSGSLRKPQQPKESMDFDDIQTKMEINKLNLLNSKFAKFRKILTSEANINLQDLRKLAWNGIPNELRAISWLLLLGYLPTNRSRQRSTLKRKRQEYVDGLNNITIEFNDESPTNDSTVSLGNSTTQNKEKQLYHQIKIDVKRTNPTMKLYAYPATQLSLRKILYFWAVRHPASGYVQGINDLCTPFYQVFLNNYIWQLQRKQIQLQQQANATNNPELEDEELFIPGYLADPNEEDEAERKLLSDPNLPNYNIDNFDTSLLSSRVTSIIEADTYWCLSRLLENITDNYIHEQPGIIRQVNELRNLISKIDAELLKHFDNEGIEFIQFSFRWMNCLLMRELPMQLIIRMWDTYLSETPLGFNTFHTYVCAAFLIRFSLELKGKDFQEILLFLQSPPTDSWTEKDVELMLSEAFIWQSLYKNAAAHLK